MCVPPPPLHHSLLARSAVCIQKYVKPRGNQAWIVRVVFKHKEDTGTEGFSYVINDTDAFVTNSKNPNTCSIVKSASSKSWAEPRQLLDKFVPVAERSLNVRFKMLAGDFVLDRNQKWWFLQVKAFELRDQIHQPVVAPPPVARLMIGGAMALTKVETRRTLWSTTTKSCSS